MNKLILLGLAASSALASHVNPFLTERQLVKVPCNEQGQKDCGEGCIDLSWTCCPSRAGGCPPTAYCNLGNNGEYNCCPRGAICDGPGGATTRRSTNTVTLPGETSTIVDESTSTSTIEVPEEPTYPPKPSSEVEVPSTTVLPPTTYTTTVENTYTEPSATPIPLPTPIDNGTSTSTSSVAIVNAGANNGFSAPNVLGGLLAGVAAFLF